MGTENDFDSEPATVVEQYIPIGREARRQRERRETEVGS